MFPQDRLPLFERLIGSLAFYGVGETITEAVAVLFQLKKSKISVQKPGDF